MNKVIIILCLLSLTLTIDYSLSLISAVAYWINTGGNEKYAGLIFGIYDASTIFITPILAWKIEKSKWSYKMIFISSLIINIIGNASYSLANYFNKWQLIAIGRFVSGIGASVLPLLMVYVTKYMSKDEQPSAVSNIKYISAISRVMGPIIGSILTISTVHNRTIIEKLFNMYTMVGWIPILIAIVAILIICKYFEDKGTDVMLPSYSVNPDDEKVPICEIIMDIMPIWIIGFISTAIYWLMIGNGFTIAIYFFDIIENEHQLWKLYISGLGGFICAFILFTISKKALSGLRGMFISIIIQTIGTYFFLIKRNWAFYVAVGVSTFGYGMMIPSVNIINNTIIKNYKENLGNFMGFMISILTAIQATARFVGPTAFSTYNFTKSIAGTNCDLSDVDHYNTSGCVITNYIKFSLIYISISSGLMILFVLLCYKCKAYKHF